LASKEQSISLDEPNYHGIFASLEKLDIFDAEPGGPDLYGPNLAAFYDRFVEDYAGDIPLFQRLLPKDNVQVLDLACGSGRIAIHLAGMFVKSCALSRET